jgi:hypothetical protein
MNHWCLKTGRFLACRHHQQKFKMQFILKVCNKIILTLTHYFTLFFNVKCIDKQTITCWIAGVKI